MISVLIVMFHIFAALALILVVLLQVGKGQSIGAAFGGAGSSQTLFGSRGPTTFLSHLTTIAAAIFMVTSLTLAYLSAHARQRSAITDQGPVTPGAPAPQLPLQPSESVPAPAAPTESAPAPAPSTESTPAPAPSTEQQQQ